LPLSRSRCRYCSESEVDELSVPVPAIAAVKALVRRLSMRHCRDLAASWWA